MAEPLPVDDPNLQLARTRFQRIQWLWAGLAAGLAILTWFTIGSSYPLAGLPWLISALLLSIMPQPALLALAAILWALSMTYLIPGMATIFGPDPISQILGASAVEVFGRAAVRLVLAVAAWTHFMQYRLLYGTVRATGLPDGHRPIPALVPNWTNQLGLATAVLGLLTVVLGLVTVAQQAGNLYVVQIGYAGAILAIGLGIGVAFSPTDRRPAALTGVVLGFVGFLLVVAVPSVVFI